MTFVVSAQTVFDGLVRDVLKFRIQRGRHRQTFFVQHLGTVFALEVLANFFDEERCNARRGVRLSTRDDRSGLGGVCLILCNVALVGHPLEHNISPLHRALHIDVRALPLGRLENARDERRLLER